MRRYVCQLLSHTSGFRIGPIFLQPLVGMSDEHPDAPSLQVEVARFGEIGAKMPPGTSYRYSNAGYNTLGALIEVASEMPLKQYLRERIYEPLGMADSCNHESDADHARMSNVFRRRGREGGWEIDWKPGDPPDYPFPRASGGMISTARDYAVFCQAFLNGGIHDGDRILLDATTGEHCAVHGRVQGLDPAAHHLGDAGQALDADYIDAQAGEGRRGASRGDDLDAAFGKGLGEARQTGLVADREERPAQGDVVGHGGRG